MKEEDLNRLHNITSCRYADKTLHEAGYDITECPEFATMLADAYENGYKQCWEDVVHVPGNPEGITSEELDHQMYGYEYGKKKLIEKACEYLKANTHTFRDDEFLEPFIEAMLND